MEIGIGIPIAIIVLVVCFFLFLNYGGSNLSGEFKSTGAFVALLIGIGAIVWLVHIRSEQTRILEENQRCLGRIDQITKAVEKYNATSFPIMENLEIAKLKKKKLVPDDITNECSYTNEGEMSNVVKIICKTHGDKQKVELTIKRYE